MLKDTAMAIWHKLGLNPRATSATTIAVVECHDGKLYCTSNDVNQISLEATAEAKKLGISPDADGHYISQAGAGFHAEMWAVILAMEALMPGVPDILDDDARLKYVLQHVSTILKNVGASRPCCKNCTDVLLKLNVAIEEQSTVFYKSWYNPMTMDVDCYPRNWYQLSQLRAIPDFRSRGINYWFNYRNNSREQKIPPETAK